jgi:hypothetical protein
MISETIVDETFIKKMKEYEHKPEGKGLLEACSENVVLFAKYMLGFSLYAWQIDFLTRLQASLHGETTTREFAAITSRQIGKTEGVVAIFGLWSIVFNKAPIKSTGMNTQVMVVSASDKQSKDLIKRVKRMMNLGNAYMKKTWDYDKFYTRLVDDKGANNTEQITLKPAVGNDDVTDTPLLKDSAIGSQIVSFPPTSKVLGSTASIIIVDEIGKNDKITDTFLEEELSPVGDANDALKAYISTPWVLSGFFYRIIDPDNLYNQYDVDKVMYSIEAIRLENPDQYAVVKKKVDLMNSDGKTAEVQRAYYCQFVKGETSYFDPESVRQCFDEDYEMIEEFKGDCDLGVDFGGQSVSKTVLTVSALDSNNVIKRLYKKVYEVGKDNNLIEEIAEVMTRFNIKRVIPDDCPQGDYLIRQMIEKGWVVTPMNFRSEKIKKYSAFRALLNKGLLKSFRDDSLKTEMYALEVSQGVRNTMIKHAAGYSDDEIDSFVLSAYHFLVEESGGRYFDMDDYEFVSSKKKSRGHYDFGW